MRAGLASTQSTVYVIAPPSPAPPRRPRRSPPLAASAAAAVPSGAVRTLYTLTTWPRPPGLFIPGPIRRATFTMRPTASHAGDDADAGGGGGGFGWAVGVGAIDGMGGSAARPEGFPSGGSVAPSAGMTAPSDAAAVPGGPVPPGAGGASDVAVRPGRRCYRRSRSGCQSLKAFKISARISGYQNLYSTY